MLEGTRRSHLPHEPRTRALAAFARPRSDFENIGIAPGADGNLWYTEPGRGGLARMTPAGVVTQFPPVPVLRSATQIGTAAVEVRCAAQPAARASAAGRSCWTTPRTADAPTGRAVPLFGWRPASGAR